MMPDPTPAPARTIEVRFPERSLADLADLRLNPFAAQLLAESFLRINQMLVDAGEEPLPGVGFELRGELPPARDFAGVRIYLEAVPAESDPEVATADV